MPGEPRTGRGRASRERIVERAAELFAERGVAATSLDEVLAAEVAEHNEGARLEAAAAFDAWERLFADALERMHERGELRADASPAVLATALLASIEGGMVLSQTRKDPASLHLAVEAGLGQVRAYLN